VSATICQTCGASLGESDEICGSCGSHAGFAASVATEPETLVRVYRRRLDYERDAGRLIHRGWSVAVESTRPKLGFIGRFLHLRPNIEITYKRSWNGSPN